MNSLNQDIISHVAYYALLAFYGVTFLTWYYFRDTLKKWVKWSIFTMIILVGNAKTFDFFANRNLFDVWFFLHPLICLMLIAIIRGYNFYVMESYASRLEYFKELFSGEACKRDFKELKRISENKESTTVFTLKFVVIVLAVMLGVLFFQSVSLKRDQTRITKITQQNAIIKEQLEDTMQVKDSAVQEAKEAEKASLKLLEHFVTKDSVTIKIE